MKNRIKYILALFLAIVLILPQTGSVFAAESDDAEEGDRSIKAITLNKSSTYLAPESSMTLVATLAPVAANSTVIWSSSDTTKAKVDASGKVLGISAGVVVITAALDFPLFGYICSATCTVTVTELPNRTFFLKNKGNNTYARVKNDNMAAGTNVVQYAVDSSDDYERWTFTLNTSTGYYSIRSEGSDTDYYMTVKNNSLNPWSQIVLGTSATADGAKWSVTKTPSGAYKIRAKTGELGDYVLSVQSSATTNNVNLIQNDYDQDTDYTDEWIICNRAILMAINDTDGADRHLYFSNVQNKLTTEERGRISLTSTVRYSSCTVNEMIDYLQKNDIFIVHTHGNKTAIKISVSGTQALVISDLDNIDLSNISLALLLTCEAGKDFNVSNITNNTPGNFVEKMVVCGAETVVGFSANTTVDDCNQFAQSLFYQLVVYHKSIVDAINSIDYTLYDYDMGNLAVIGGNGDLLIR